ncbi:GNAT family N-acetyltransferase [Kinneretia aquatilis]|uniref:GNAT family N-acetyltransferase n=1 Tax=Kinneretia aquatilis TaxID=2070761 RepID=UPI0014950B58|nr:GNAT family N-acetyltransferase [Paucibacter aquatile]WIV96792.1 GNAT family N-acetyltransferase [Paucibacter aquatile]
MFHIRANTRDNAISPERLVKLGITPATLGDALEHGEVCGWLAVDGADRAVGFCNVDPASGEVLVLAVLSGQEGQGVGRALLDAAVTHLQSVGSPPPWLMAGANPALRAHGFYRAQGWKPSGRRDAQGDEELRLDTH